MQVFKQKCTPGENAMEKGTPELAMVKTEIRKSQIVDLGKLFLVFHLWINAITSQEVFVLHET